MEIRIYSPLPAITAALMVLGLAGASLADDSSEGQTFPLTVNVNVVNVYEVAGLSDESTQGNIGIAGMHELCQDTFGNRARMCTTEEVVKSPRIVGLLEPGEAGWAQPMIAAVIFDPNPAPRGGFQVRDVTGVNVTFATNALAAAGISCRQWSQGNRFGGTVLARTDAGTFLTAQDCNRENNVLCCVPSESQRRGP